MLAMNSQTQPPGCWHPQRHYSLKKAKAWGFPVEDPLRALGKSRGESGLEDQPSPLLASWKDRNILTCSWVRAACTEPFTLTHCLQSDSTWQQHPWSVDHITGQTSWPGCKPLIFFKSSTSNIMCRTVWFSSLWESLALVNRCQSPATFVTRLHLTPWLWELFSVMIHLV